MNTESQDYDTVAQYYNSAKEVSTAQNVYTLLHEYSTKEKEHFLLITLDGSSHVSIFKAGMKFHLF